MEIGDRLDTSIDRLAYGGDGVAHPDGFAVFVPRGVPGDEMSIELTAVRRRYARALPSVLKQPSKHRVTPACMHFDRCGGCHYQHIDPEFVTEQKRAHVVDSLERLGPGGVDVAAMFVPESTWNYRNRVTIHRDEKGNQGYIAWRNHEVIDVGECPIAQREVNELWAAVRPILTPFSAKLIPYVVLRYTTTGQSAVIVSVTDRKVSEKLPRAFSEFSEEVSIHVTLVQPESRSPFGKEIVPLRGPEVVTEKIGETEYVLRPDLFFQVHPEVTEKIVSDVVAWAKEVNASRILDVYCGAGLFGLPLARADIASLGVESTYPSIKSAEVSAERSDLSEWAKFRAGKAERILHRLLKEGESFEHAIVDPPRRGLNDDVIEALPKLGIRNLLYVSCSPPTLARDLKKLQELGYRAKSVQPYDMFPQTYHLETLTRLSRGRSVP